MSNNRCCTGISFNQKIQATTIQLATPVLGSTARFLLEQVEDDAIAYLHEVTEKYANAAGAAFKAFENFKTLSGGNPDSISMARLYALADTLFQLADNDPVIEQRINKSIRDTSLQRLFHAGPPAFFEQKQSDSRQEGLALVDLRAQLALIEVLEYCSNKTAGGGAFDVHVPGISPMAVYPRVGEPFRADFFLMTYSSFYPSGMAVKINGNFYPVREGVAKYSHVFTKPGKHILNVQMEVKELKRKPVFSKEFEVNVLPR